MEWLLRYAPELNDIERSRRDLERRHFAHRTVLDAADLTAVVHAAVKQLNKERQTPYPRSYAGTWVTTV